MSRIDGFVQTKHQLFDSRYKNRDKCGTKTKNVQITEGKRLRNVKKKLLKRKLGSVLSP